MSPTPTRASRQLDAQVFALVVLAVLLGLLGPLGRWGAAAIAIFVWPLARATTSTWVHGGPPRIRALAQQLRAQAPLLVVLGAAAYTLFPLWLGQAPASRDHSVHYLQSQVFVDQLLEHGRLRGPSFALNSGYPFGDSYPVLGYALTSAAHLLSAKLVSLRTSYALGLCAVWAVHLWAVAALAKRACVSLDLGPKTGGGPSTANASSLAAWAGAAAALAFLFDPGSARQGGWNYTMFHGVWPQLLSTGLFLASLELGLRAREQRSWRAIARFAAVWAASIVAHPFGWITGAVAMVAWPLLSLVSAFESDSDASVEPQADSTPAGASMWIWAIPTVLVLGLVAHHVVVFLLSRGAMARVPVPWLGLGELTRALVLGEIFTGSRALIAVLASFGFALALRRRALLPLALSAVFALLLVLASRESITVLRLDLSVPGLENLQFPRYAFSLKGLWCVLAGLGAAGALHLLRQVGATRQTGEASPQPAASAVTWPGPARALMAMVLGPLLASALEQPANALPRPVGATESFAQTRAGPGDHALRAAIERERDAGVPLGRVAFLRAGMRGATYPLYAIVDAGLPVVLDAHIPSVNFRHRLHERDPDALRAMGVTHVIYMPTPGSGAVSNAGLGEPDAHLAEELEPIVDPLVQAHGIEFARLRGGNPAGLPWARARPASGQASTSARVRMQHLGAGQLDALPVSRWAGEGFAIHVESADPNTPVSVELAIAPYRAWVLRDAAGKVVDPAQIYAARVAAGTPGMRVSLVPGSYSLRWERSGLERASGWASLVAWLLVLGAAFWPARTLREPRARLTATSAAAFGPAATRKVWLLLPVGAALIFATSVQQQRKLQANWRPHFDDAPGQITDFVVAEAMRPDPRQALDCSGVDGRDAMEGCTAATHGSHVDFSYRRPKIFRCLSMELQAGQRRSLFIVDSLHPRLSAFATGPGTVRLGQGELSVAADRIGRRRLKLKRRLSDSGAPPAGWPLWVENQGKEATRVCVAAAGLRQAP